MRYFALLLSLLLILTGCSHVEKKEETPVQTEQISKGSETDKQEGIVPVSESDMFIDRDLDASYSDVVTIELDGKKANASSNTVKIFDNTVTITEEADYLISGSYEGILKVETDEKAKPHLIFDSVEIVNDSYAALYITEADKVVVTLKGESILKNGGSFESLDENEVDAAVFSKQDLSFNGEGSVKVESVGGHGIVCKDDLVFTGGSYTVYSASHGIDSNDSIRAVNSSFTVDSGKDALRSENNEDSSLGFVYIENGSFTLKADGDGISASSFMQIKDGEFNITSGGGAVNGSKQTSVGWGGYYSNSSAEDSESIKGIKAKGNIFLEGGSFSIDSADDAIHSNTAITVDGGSFEIKSGDDGFHADNSLVINKGDISIKECYEGLEAFEVTVNGGDINVYADDDGINAAGGNDESGYGGRGNDIFGGPGGMDNGGVITIADGKVYLNAMGDAIDSNGELYIKGGEVTVSGPTQGDTSILDFAAEGVITGGSFVGTGGNMMNECFDSASTQGVIMVNIFGNADTAVILTDSEGNLIFDYSADQAFSCIILSHTDIKVGETYTLSVGGESYEISMNEIIYSQSGFGDGMPGGMPGSGRMPGGMHRPGW